MIYRRFCYSTKSMWRRHAVASTTSPASFMMKCINILLVITIVCWKHFSRLFDRRVKPANQFINNTVLNVVFCYISKGGSI